ncbi:MAG: fused DSP-PTPase phosphatase/NAD kinase-like protein [Blastocatellia bacterium]
MSTYSRLEKLRKIFSPVTIAFSPKVRISLIAISVALALGIVSSARSDHGNEKATSNSKTNDVAVEVGNFGKVTEFYYRGAQPKGVEYNQLATIGVKTIIDLRHDPKDYAKTLAEQAGMKYINFPMSDKDYPSSDTASKFLTLVSDKENWPVYVHCAGGRHRTGAMTAVFRMTNQGWDINRAYEEMKEYDFYTRWGHKAMKKFVFDYYRDLNNKQAENPIADSINQ